MAELMRPSKIKQQEQLQLPLEPAALVAAEPVSQDVDYATLLMSCRAALEIFNQRLDAVEEVIRLRDDRNEWQQQAIAKEAEIKQLQAQLTKP